MKLLLINNGLPCMPLSPAVAGVPVFKNSFFFFLCALIPPFVFEGQRVWRGLGNE